MPSYRQQIVANLLNFVVCYFFDKVLYGVDIFHSLLFRFWFFIEIKHTQIFDYKSKMKAKVSFSLKNEYVKRKKNAVIILIFLFSFNFLKFPFESFEIYCFNPLFLYLHFL